MLYTFLTPPDPYFLPHYGAFRAILPLPCEGGRPLTFDRVPALLRALQAIAQSWAEKNQRIRLDKENPHGACVDLDPELGGGQNAHNAKV